MIINNRIKKSFINFITNLKEMNNKRTLVYQQQQKSRDSQMHTFLMDHFAIPWI